MSFKRYAPRPYALPQPLKKEQDPRGPSYGFVYVIRSPPFEAHRQRLSGAERFSFGATATKILERVTSDMPAPVVQTDRLRFPDADYNVTSIVEYPSRGVCIIETERV